MTSIILQYISNRNHIKYSRSGIYCIDPRDAQRKTFYVINEGSIFIFDIHPTNPEVFCKVFEDNQSCISIEESNKLTPGIKHIGIKYHNFQGSVQNKIIWIYYSYTREQAVDIFTKPLNK